MPPRIRSCRASTPRLIAALFGAIGLACSAVAAPSRGTKTRESAVQTPPAISTETLPQLLQRGAQSFAGGAFAEAADAFRRVEEAFGTEREWQSGQLPRKLLPLRGFAALRAGQADEAVHDLAAYLERYPDDRGNRSFALYALALAHQKSGQPESAIARFRQFEAEHPGTAQATLARLQRAEICFEAGQTDEGFAVLDAVRAAPEIADSLRVQARLRALEKAVELGREPLALDLLLGQPWSVSTMPEIAVLGFAAMETGDRLLATGRAAEALRAFRLVPPKRQLLAAQRLRLDELKRVFAARAGAAASGSGLFWTDFYRARIDRIAAQLAALEAAEDYSWALRLRIGQAHLLAGRGHEAWLCFECVALSDTAGEDLRQDAHYRWILAAAELSRWDEALVIARAFVERYPASDLAPEAFFLISRAHLEQHQFAAAETVLSDVLERFPAHPAALRSRFTRGWVRTMRENYGAARTDFEICVDSAPGGPLAAQAGLWRGLTFHFERDHTAALAAFDQLAETLRGDPLLPEISYRRATTLYAMRDLGRARAEMEAFVSTYPMHARHPEALILLGDILMGAGELPEARRRFEQVPPDAADAFVYATFQTGKILRALGDHAGMVQHYAAYVRRATLARLPRVSEALFHIGWAHEQQGRPEAALPVYAEALARFGNDPSAGEVGSILLALQKLDRRIARAEPAVGDTSGSAHLLAGGFEAWLHRERDRARTDGLATLHARLVLAQADLHLARKEPAQAEQLVLELAASTPIDAMDATTLARVGTGLQAIGSTEASSFFRHLLATYPRSAERAVAFHGLAMDAAGERRFAEALAWTARFEAETPAHALASEVKLLSGDVLAATGRTADASRQFDDVLRLKSARGRPHARALVGLARCARLDGDGPRAIAYLQRIYTLHRAQRDLAAEAYLDSAPLFEQLGDSAAAAATYREMLALPDIGDAAQRERAHTALADLERRLTPAAAKSGTDSEGPG